MSPHPCPFTLGQLPALHAIAKVAGHDKLAALDHSRHHETEEEQ